MNIDGQFSSNPTVQIVVWKGIPAASAIGKKNATATLAL